MFQWHFLFQLKGYLTKSWILLAPSWILKVLLVSARPADQMLFFFSRKITSRTSDVSRNPQNCTLEFTMLNVRQLITLLGKAPSESKDFSPNVKMFSRTVWSVVYQIFNMKIKQELFLFKKLLRALISSVGSGTSESLFFQQPALKMHVCVYVD